MSFTSSAPERWSDVYLAAAARAVSMCGDFVAAVALVLALQARGAGGIAVAAVLLAAAVPSAVLAPLTGRLVDRVDSRVLIISTSLAQAGICLGLAYVHGTLPIVVLLATLAAGLAITQPALGALVPDMVGRANLPRAVAIGQTATSIGILAGPAVGGLLVGAFGLRVPLVVDALTYLALAVAGLLLRTRRGSAAGAGTSDAARPAGWALWQDRPLWLLLVVSAAVVAAVSAINVLEVFFVRGTLHASTTAYGLLGAVWSGFMLVGGWLLTRRGSTDAGLSRASLGLLLVTSLVVVTSAVVPSVAWLIPLWAIGGITNGGENAAASILLGRRVPAPVRGRAIAVYSGLMNGSAAIGFILGGVLLPLISLRPLIALTGLAGVVAVAAGAPPMLRALRPAAHPAAVTTPTQLTPAYRRQP